MTTTTPTQVLRVKALYCAPNGPCYRQDETLYADADGMLCTAFGEPYTLTGHANLAGWGDLDGPAVILALDGARWSYLIPVATYRRAVTLAAR